MSDNMRMLLVTGGMRSGKSTYAQRRAQSYGQSHVTYIATARRSDVEMSERIQRHKDDRPGDWITIEEPLNVSGAILHATTPTIVVDCITVLVANVLESQHPASLQDAINAVVDHTHELCETLTRRAGHIVVVTNEVGLSVHPTTDIGRWYQECMGHANQRLAKYATEVVMMVSGLPLALKPVPAP